LPPEENFDLVSDPSDAAGGDWLGRRDPKVRRRKAQTTATTSLKKQSVQKRLPIPSRWTMVVDIVPISSATFVPSSLTLAGNTFIKSPFPPPPRNPAQDTTLQCQLRSKKTKRATSLGKDAPTPPFPHKTPTHPPTKKSVTLNLKQTCNPAYRTEVLDMLATIELKLTLLRKRLYAEKIEALAWEETLIANGVYAKPTVCALFCERFSDYRPTTGVHLELTHLDEKLSKRKDKHLEAMKRKRAAKNAV
jgi:hypothetical protein